MTEKDDQLAALNARLQEEVKEHRRTAACLEDSLAKLHEAQDQIDQQARLVSLGHMANGIAHDFNNELQQILGFVELLLGRPENLKDENKVRQHLETIRDSANNAANIVRRLRDFYNPQIDPDTCRPVDFKKLVEQVISLTQPEWRDGGMAKGKKISLRAEISDDIPPVAADEAKLQQVLTNIIFNSVDAIPEGTEGSIIIRSFLEEQYFCLAISDDGIGMSKEVRRSCFEPFYTTRPESSSGMGLATAQGLIEKHGGKIEIESEKGKGTTVTIYLPLRNDLQDADDVPAETGSIAILFVDDEPNVLKVIAKFLEGLGHAVKTAANGQEALEIFGREHFDLVITDMAMPGMSGDMVAFAVKAKKPGTPVLMLTGFGDLQKAQGEKPEGVDIILSKPASPKALQAAIAKAVKA